MKTPAEGFRGLSLAFLTESVSFLFMPHNLVATGHIGLHYEEMPEAWFSVLSEVFSLVVQY